MIVLKTVSVVIPVFNSELYLNECIKSVVNQSYDCLEILLVDDGSTDSSAQICDNWAQIDNRIKVLHVKNEGVSHARNLGVEVATGEFITFIDSDDIVDFDYIRDLISIIDCCNVDLAICGFKKSNKNKKRNIGNKVKILKQDEAIKAVLKGCPFGGHVCGKLFKRDIIKKIKFNCSVSICEDLLFVLNYVSLCQKVGYIRKKLYVYIMRSDSACHSQINESKLSALVVSNLIKELLPSKYELYVRYNKLMILLMLISMTANADNQGYYLSVLNDKFKETYDKRVLRICSLKTKVKLLLIKRDMKTYVKLLRFFHNI